PDPYDDHADRAFDAAAAMHTAQRDVNAAWRGEGQTPFGIRLGPSPRVVAAGLLGGGGRVQATVRRPGVAPWQRLRRPPPTGPAAGGVAEGQARGEQGAWAQVGKGRYPPVVADRIGPSDEGGGA